MPDDTTDVEKRDWTRILLVACCVLAAVVAALMVPALASDDVAGTPIDSVLPGERFDDNEGESGSGGLGSGGFGALNPGDRTGVGGDTGLDNGTFASNDTEVHFEVQSSQPAYWRTGAYGTYTGTGWERNGATEPYEGPLQTTGLTSERLEFDVTLEEPARALPTVWQPRSISGVRDLTVTDTGGVRSEDVLPSGTTFTGTTFLQENDVDLLRAAGREYPTEIERRYTQLPPGTPERVGELTAQLTADDETAYDAAMTVQHWLRTEKEYSLAASRQSDHIADTFIFEMEAGYCEYFATAMTTMLRSQGIPARYAVGYSTGQPTGDSTYEVRAMNAHAWVEVYFPDVGWVKFDPTPGGSRLAAQSAVLEDELGEAVDLQEPGSPGERFRPGEIQSLNETDDSNEGNSDGAYDISLNRTAVPGMAVEVEVTHEGEPVVAAPVSVNGEAVGQTGISGTVDIVVPDDEELHITVGEPELIFVDDTPQEADLNESMVESGMNLTVVGNESWDDTEFNVPFDKYSLNESLTGDAESDSENESSDQEVLAIGSAGGVASGDGRLYGPRQNDGVPSLEPTASEGTDTRTTQEAEANATYSIETDATVTVSGDVFPGETVTVSATVGDVAIPDADVLVNGTRVATTGDGGRAEIPLPDDPGEVRIEVEREAVSGETTVALPELELTVETGVLTLPLGTATAEVRAGDRPVVDAPIEVNGDRVATTGTDGTAEVRLPLSVSATVEASSYGMTEQATVTGLVRNLVLVLGATALVVGLPVAAVRRREFSLRGGVARLRWGVQATVRYAQLALVAVARHGDEWLWLGVARMRASVLTLLDALRGRVEPAELSRSFVAWLRAKRRRIRLVLGRSAGGENRNDEPVEQGIRKAWQEFLTHVSVSQPSTHTPGELATHAVESDGLPAAPVRTLVDAFREVEYGARPERDRLARVERALDAIEPHAEEDATGATTRTVDSRADGQVGVGDGPGREQVTTDGGTGGTVDGDAEGTVDGETGRSDGSNPPDRSSTGGEP